MPAEKKAAPWCPNACPITGLLFFMWIEHSDDGMVPTYGGPFDSYTIPTRDEDGTFERERFCHDRGYWVDSEHVDLRLIDGQSDECDEGQVAELQAQIERLRDRSRTITLSGVEFTENELIGRAVRSVSGTSRYKTPRWVLMKGAFGCGSGVATALCRRFNFDPDEELRK